MRNISKQLEALKSHPEAGALSREAHEANKSRLLLSIGHDFSKEGVAQPLFPSWVLQSFVSKPLAIGVTGMALMTTGWMTTVSAAADSLPGDRLYSVKLLSEKAQLQISSLDRRAVLHTEFAERRLLEVAELRSDVARSTATETPALVEETLNAYKKEMQSAQADLQELREATTDTKEVVQTVTEVQQNIGAIEVALDTAAAKSSTVEGTEEAIEAKEVTQAIEQTAVDVAVGVHEEVQTEESQHGVSEMFRTQLGTVQGRATVNQHRIDVIRAVLSANAKAFTDIAGLPTTNELKALEYEIEQAMGDVPKAMDAFALGAVRSAFDALSSADEQLLALETKLATIELTITNTLSAARATEAAQESVEPVTASQE